MAPAAVALGVAAVGVSAEAPAAVARAGARAGASAAVASVVAGAAAASSVCFPPTPALQRYRGRCRPLQVGA